MFKSRIPLQTPIALKLVLFGILAISFTAWSTSSEASNPQISLKTQVVAASQSDRELTQIAHLAHQKVNEYRASKNLPPLKLNAVISEQAKIHSLNMAQHTVPFSHDGFQTRVQAIGKNITYKTVAENVAYNSGYRDPVNTAVEGWIKSDGHRKNMEGNYNLTGMGVAVNSDGEYYFTQIFILEN